MRHCLTLAICCVPLLAAAQDADLDARRALAARIVAGPVYGQMVDRVISPEALLAQISAGAGGLSPEHMTALEAAAAEQVLTARPEVEAIFAASAARSFTLEELQALDRAFSDPAVASAFAKLDGFNGVVGRQLSLYLTELRRRIIRQGAAARGE